LTKVNSKIENDCAEFFLPPLFKPDLCYAFWRLCMNTLRILLITTLMVMTCFVAELRALPATPEFAELAELTASDGTPGYGLGSSIAMSASTIVAAAPFEPAVYVFVKSPGGWTSATQIAKLTASDGTGFDTVAIRSDGGVVVAGARESAVYVFVKPASGWANMTETAILSSSDQADNLGVSLAISGNTVVAGSSQFQNGSGLAYLFVKPATGWANMTETAKLNPSDGSGPFSTAAISGNTVAIGELGTVVNSNSQQGAVYVFVKPANGWVDMTQTAKLTASDGVANDELGTSVAISDGTIVAGAPLAKIGTHDFQGAAYIFVKPAAGWINSTQAAKLTDSDGKYQTKLGTSVSVSANTVVVGAPNQSLGRTQVQGAAYVFTKPVTGWANANQTARLTASDGSGALATSVAVSGSTVAAGAPSVTVGSNKLQGAIYVFGPAQGNNGIIAGRNKRSE
jgi:hypothetical protein